MNKYDLRTGMVVTCRNGEKFQVFLGCYDAECYEKDVLVSLDGLLWMQLDNFNNDLINVQNDNYTVMKVYTPCIFTDLIKPNRYLDWSRKWERVTVRELTVSAIEKLLGYPVKIVKE